MALALGTKLGLYEILALVGAGGMGEVYRARDSTLKREVAIKVLPPSFSKDLERLRRFQQEAQAVAALNHPNILSIYHVGQQGGSPYMVTELLEGETLRERLRQGALRSRTAVDYGVQAARGLAAAHEKGIVHRDLKPENLFVTKDERIKILDFGLAKPTQPEPTSGASAPTLEVGTEAGKMLGTVGYMSPEQVRGKPADSRSDIFAFGAILYEMLTGCRAYKGETAADTLSAILMEDPSGISGTDRHISPALERVVRRCLEKAPEQRFQSAQDLGYALEVASASSDSGIATGSLARVEDGRRVLLKWLVAFVIVLAAIAAIVWWRWPKAIPVITGVVQITNDGLPKPGFDALVSDGSRVYFGEVRAGNYVIAQVSAAGGQTGVVPSRFADTTLHDLAPDYTALLVEEMGELAKQLWALPLPAGEARRLGDITAIDASFFPDGQHIVYSDGNRTFVANNDGSNPRKLMDRFAEDPRVSSDGRKVRFTLHGDDGFPSLWEVAADGSGLQQLLKDWPPVSQPCCGRWTADERYFVFQAGGDLWALPQKRGLDWGSKEPIRLTNGPLSYSLPLPSRDGGQIFAIGSKRRGELVRYDAKSQQFVPYLSGISTLDVVFSRDGQWVAYVSYPDITLWRMRADGNDRLQLTSGPMFPVLPKLSPDGKKIAFGAYNVGKVTNIYVADTMAGTLQKLVDDANAPTWSPDGNLIAFTAGVEDSSGKRFVELHVINLTTGKISTIPDSRGKQGSFWSVDGRFLIASNPDQTKLLRFDFTTQEWSELAAGYILDYFLSHDGKYMYCVGPVSGETKAFRVHVTDGKIEVITSLKDFRRVSDDFLSTWVGSAPDGSLLLTRDLGTQEIYALRVRWP